MAHLSVCVSICLSGSDVTQMLRLMFPQPAFPPTSPYSSHSSCFPPQGKKNVLGSSSVHPRLQATAQVSNWLCDRAAQEEPPLHCPPLVLPAAAVALRN